MRRGHDVTTHEKGRFKGMAMVVNESRMTARLTDNNAFAERFVILAGAST